MIIESIKGYTTQIGHLVSMMNYARMTTLEAVEGLSQKELDYRPTELSNSIGALLFHIAAIEKGFQIELFEGREPNENEIDFWGAAYTLGEKGRKQIHGYPLSDYKDKLESVRRLTLETFQEKTDQWLYEERLWENRTSNNYFIWYHVFEDEINHRGQIRMLKKMITNGGII